MTRAKENLVLALVILIASAVMFTIMVNYMRLSDESLISYVLHKGYRPHVNVIYPILIADRPLYSYYYVIILVSFAVVIVLRRVPQLRLLKDRGLQSILFTLGLFFFVLSLGIQSIVLVNYQLDEYQNLGGKSLHERQLSIGSRRAYFFAELAKEILTGQGGSDLITGMDETKDPGMLATNLLTYHLYPIDVRRIRKEPLQSLIYYQKENAAAYVPEDFEIILKINDWNLIAVKKDVLDAHR